MTLGEIVKHFRITHNWSMDKFAQESKLSKGYISMLEKNENPKSKKPIIPSLETIKRVSQVINIDVDSLIKQLDSNQGIALVDEAEYQIGKDLDAIYAKEPCHLRLKKALDIRGLTQKDLCSLTEINKSTISQYLNGLYEPSQSKMKIISRVLQINEAWLMGYDVPMEIQPFLELSLQESLHLEKYRKLNSSGRQRADQQLDDLLLISKYTAAEEKEINRDSAV